MIWKEKIFKSVQFHLQTVQYITLHYSTLQYITYSICTASCLKPARIQSTGRSSNYFLLKQYTVLHIQLVIHIQCKEGVHWHISVLRPKVQTNNNKKTELVKKKI